MDPDFKKEMDDLICLNKELTEMKFRHIETELIFSDNERLKKENETLKVAIDK